MLGMSHIRWPKDVVFQRVELEPDDRRCAHCGRYTYVFDHRHRHVRALGEPQHIVSKVCCCPDRACPGHADKRASDREILIAPLHWSVNMDLFAWMGHRRCSRHWSVPQICAELKDRFGVWISEDVVEDYTARYEVIVAARESDLARLVAEYLDTPDLILCIDGLQPEKGHETLYVVRELRRGRIWFAEPLLSSAAGEVQRLFERARDLALRIGKPVRGWMSDKQEAFVSGVKEVFPGVPHRYCANHFLRDAAKPMLEADSHAKVQMRRKVRGLRKIERGILKQRGNSEAVASAETLPTTDTAGSGKDPKPAIEGTGIGEGAQVVLDYCATVRGVLNDDQGGPLHPPGVRMAKALAEVHDSIGRALVEKKGGSAKVRSTPSPAALSGAPRWCRSN